MEAENVVHNQEFWSVLWEIKVGCTKNNSKHDVNILNAEISYASIRRTFIKSILYTKIIQVFFLNEIVLL